MLPADLAKFEHVVGKPRIASYRNYFKATTLQEAIGLYMWNCELSSCFGTLLSYFEITLRNNVHRGMSLNYSAPGSISESCHWWDLIQTQLSAKTYEKVTDVRQKYGASVNPDEIVSRVSFGFWGSILSKVNSSFVRSIFPVIFPYHPLNTNTNDWRDGVKRKAAIQFVFELNQFRNRLAHHEPLWKFGKVMNTSVNPPAVLTPASVDCPTSLARFTALLQVFDDAMSAMNQSLHQDLLNSSWRRRLNFLISSRGVDRYRYGKYISGHGAPILPNALEANFSQIINNNALIRVALNGDSGTFVPD